MAFIGAVLGFTFNLAGVIVPVAFAIKDAIPKEAGISMVSILTGDGTTKNPLRDAGGTVPHIALWDNNGQRLAQYHSKNSEKMVQGGKPTMISLAHTQNGNKFADPYYVMLSQLDTDAVCIASVQVSNGAITGTFYGDTGFSCGQSWFYSSRQLGAELVTPKCVWLDGDHSNGLNARAMSFHLNDMIPSNDKINMYSKNNDYLCKSTPRFSYWGNLLPDAIIPFFNPPLEYNTDDKSGGEGADVDPDLALDKIVYDKGVFMKQGEKTAHRRNNRPGISPETNSTRQGANHDPSHLVITEMDGQSAKELCEHPNSYGWDLVSIKDNYYCDMTEKEIYNLCDEVTKSNCFDLQRKVLVGHGGISARGEVSQDGVPMKKYDTSAHWKN
ncbi:hypothetical protein B0J14DRAFT_529740 [Halenospora varia]|nr:hypothetical protein B0J14DRAFT_529740 [Halenospora varia]